MGFKGFTGKDGSKRRGKLALRPWRGGEREELRFYVNHPDCKAKIWFVRDEDGDWELKKWDNEPSEYPEFAHDDHNLSPAEAVAVKVLDHCYGPLNSALLEDQISNILDGEEKKFVASETLKADDGDEEDDPLPDF